MLMRSTAGAISLRPTQMMKMDRYTIHKWVVTLGVLGKKINIPCLIHDT